MEGTTLKIMFRLLSKTTLFYIARAPLIVERLPSDFSMGKFPVADKAFNSVLVCMKCKTRNPKGATKCRKCQYTKLRPKRARKKKA